MKAGWSDAPLVLQDLAKAIPVISDNELPLLTRNNFQTPSPPFIFWLSVGPPLILRTPLLFEIAVYKLPYNNNKMIIFMNII